MVEQHYSLQVVAPRLAELLRSAVQQEAFFNVQYVREKWQAHLEGKRNNQTLLWNILMFQVWLEEQNGIA